MIKNLTSKTGRKASRIFLGTASLPYASGEECNDLLDEMEESGITAIDTARQYGKAELCIGKWFSARGNREQIFLLTKCAHPGVSGKSRVGEREIRSDLERSLQALQTDYADALLLHRDDETIPAGEIVEWCNSLLREGKILHYGASNWSDLRICEANEYAAAHDLVPMSISSPHFSLAEQVADPWGGGCVSITGKTARGARAWYQETGMPVLAYSCLGRGLFSGKVHDEDTARLFLDRYSFLGYACERNFERCRRAKILAKKYDVSVAQIALAWLFRQNMNVYAVIGTSSPARMRDNFTALSLSLSDDECRWLDLEEEKDERDFVENQSI